MGGHLVATWVAKFSYAAVFVLLVACGLGAPLSEDVIVLAGGAAVAHTHGVLWVMMLTAYVGKLTGDVLLFHFGRRVGPVLYSKPRFAKLFTPKRVAWVEEHFRRYGMATVIFARFLPGLRAPTYLIAGASGFSFWKFLIADSAAAAASAPLLTWAGYRYGHHATHFVHEASWGVLAFAAVVFVALLILHVLRERRLKGLRKDAEKMTGPGGLPPLDPRRP